MTILFITTWHWYVSFCKYNARNLVWNWYGSMEDCLPFHSWNLPFHSILEIFHSIPFWHLPYSIPKFLFHSIFHSIPCHALPKSRPRECSLKHIFGSLFFCLKHAAYLASKAILPWFENIELQVFWSKKNFVSTIFLFIIFSIFCWKTEVSKSCSFGDRKSLKVSNFGSDLEYRTSMFITSQKEFITIEKSIF